MKGVGGKEFLPALASPPPNFVPRKAERAAKKVLFYRFIPLIFVGQLVILLKICFTFLAYFSEDFTIY